MAFCEAFFIGSLVSLDYSVLKIIMYVELSLVLGENDIEYALLNSIAIERAI